MKRAQVTRVVLLLLLTTLSPASALASEPLARVRFSTSGDRVMVPVSMNGSNGFSFLLDTGYGITMIHPALPEALQLRRAGQITIAGIAGDEKAPTFEDAVIDIGGARYEPRRVASLPSEGNRRRRRDGILGSGLFRQYVVEIDFVGKQLSLHSPSNFIYGGKGEVIPLRFRRGGTTPIISASIPGTNNVLIPAEYEIDTGCDSSICLGHDFIVSNHLPAEAETRAGGKFGVGGGAQTRSGHLPRLHIGEMKVEKPDVDFFIEGSPVDNPLAGHIGIGALKHFKVIFDYSRRQMILEKPAAR
jgi:hypothetical protein